jgi:hypothetical protein
MTFSFRTLLVTLALGAFACALAETAGEAPAAGSQAIAPVEATEFPTRFYANILVMGGPGPGGNSRMMLILERWSTIEERQAMLRALKDGGQTALVAQMDKADVGRLSIGDELGWPVRLASMRKTASGTTIRIATNRPITMIEQQRMARSEDYPIAFIEFTMPADGKTGEGSLNLATRVKIDESGEIVVESLPGNTSPQQLRNVRQERPKKKK